jgi:hypothetical protein
MNLIINLEHDDDILHDDSVTLESVGIGSFCSLPHCSIPFVLNSHLLSLVEHESEISFFNGELYETFKLNPQQNW